MNPVVEVELTCELCGSQLHKRRVADMSVPRFDLVMCGNTNCENNGTLIVLQPLTLNKQNWEVFAEVKVTKYVKVDRYGVDMGAFAPKGGR